MGMNEAKEHLRAMGLEERIIVPEADTATVELAAQALGVEPGRIAIAGLIVGYVGPAY